MFEKLLQCFNVGRNVYFGFFDVLAEPLSSDLEIIVSETVTSVCKFKETTIKNVYFGFFDMLAEPLSSDLGIIVSETVTSVCKFKETKIKKVKLQRSAPNRRWMTNKGISRARSWPSECEAIFKVFEAVRESARQKGERRRSHHPDGVLHHLGIGC